MNDKVEIKELESVSGGVMVERNDDVFSQPSVPEKNNELFQEAEKFKRLAGMTQKKK